MMSRTRKSALSPRQILSGQRVRRVSGDRKIALQLQTLKEREKILQIYAPTSESEDHEIEEIQEKKEKLLKS